MRLWDYVKEVMGLRKKEMIRLRGFLERNKIFFDLFLTTILSIVLSFWGYKLNVRNVEINEKNSEISERQLEIVENSKKPRFVIKSDFLLGKTIYEGNEKKIPRYSYTIINEGEDISEFSISPKSYIYFYMPTNTEQEYYIFKCEANDFILDGSDSIMPGEKDKEISFHEYVLREDGAREWEEIAKEVARHFIDTKYNHKNLVDISYRDYMGENKKETFEFDDWAIRAAQNEEGCIRLENDTGCELGYDPEVDEVAEGMIKEIEEWLKKNQGAKGNKMPNDIAFEYLR